MSLVTSFAVLLIIPVVLWFTGQKLLSRKLKNISVSAISAVCLYVFILVGAAYVERKLDIELAAFDLNGDGFFSGNEVTPEQREAMHLVTADTGRTFAPFTGAVFSVIYFFITWMVLSITSWIGMWRAGKNS